MNNKKPPNRARKHQIVVRFNDEEKAELDKAMKNLSYERRAQLVKDALTNKTLYKNILRNVLFELNKQGSNLNQIAKKANTDTSLSVEILEAINKIKEQNVELLKYVSK
ncbi:MULTISPECIES: plasmid mobilization relaxosome protein MobC [Burkholderiaceae]|uniref:plasmid mobilization relaxosome protein MobC n=1 Tax=Burkholderiaceae TaxID=119060 RepID=UPI000F5416BE|nr:MULTISPECIES: plasmid mobilization relaxosome protein MobC [Burkholderiaceae]